MGRIRNDVTGVFHTSRGVLRAGDSVPNGVVIHSRYLDEVVVDDAPSRNASTVEWKSFLASKGVAFSEDAKRDELRDLWLPSE